MTDAPTEPSKEAAVTRSDVWDAIWLWMKSGGDRGKRTEDLNDALDRFRAAGVREERQYWRKLLEFAREALASHKCYGYISPQHEVQLRQAVSDADKHFGASPMTNPAKDAERLVEIRRDLRSAEYVTKFADAWKEAQKLSAQSASDDVERAREIEGCDNGRTHCFTWLDHGKLCDKCTKITTALTAARREGAELRALDEAVVEVCGRQSYERDFFGARAPKWNEMSELQRRPFIVRARETLQTACDALAARDAATGRPTQKSRLRMTGGRHR